MRPSGIPNGMRLRIIGQSMFYADDAYSKGDYETAFNSYRRIAKLGSSYGQLRTGFMYTNGIGVEQDLIQAVKYFRAAAKQGDESAQFNMGVMYTYGHGVKRNYRKAAEYYRKAAEQNFAHAQYNLGVMYLFGYHYKQNDKKAADLFLKAAHQEFGPAQKNLALMSRRKRLIGIKDKGKTLMRYQEYALARHPEKLKALLSGTWDEYSGFSSGQIKNLLR